MGVCVGNIVDQSFAKLLADPLVIQEEKRFVLAYGKAYATSELITPEGWRSTWQVKVVARIEDAVAHEIVDSSVYLIRA